MTAATNPARLRGSLRQTKAHASSSRANTLPTTGVWFRIRWRCAPDMGHVLLLENFVTPTRCGWLKPRAHEKARVLAGPGFFEIISNVRLLQLGAVEGLPVVE